MMERAAIAAAMALAIVGFLAAPQPVVADQLASGSAGADVRMSDDSFSAHVEPSVAVDPRNPQDLLAASQLFSSSQHVLGTYVSFDGGATWRDNGPLPAPSGADTGDDVTVAFDEHGVGYVAAMMTKTTRSGYSQNDRGIYIWRTFNGGRTFGPPVAVVRHRFVDHPWLAVGRGAAGAVPVYVVWVTADHMGLGFASSSNSGRSFGTTRTISKPTGGVSTPVLATGPGDTLYASFLTSPRGADPDASLSRTHATAAPSAGTAEAHLDLVASHDGGARFSPARALASSPAVLSPQASVEIPTGPSLAVDPRSGTAYLAFTASCRGGSASAIVVERSANARHTWSQPTIVTTPNPLSQAVYFQPQVTVDQAGGVDVSYLELTQQGVSIVLARSTTGASSFGEPLAITEQAFQPALGLHTAKTGAWWIGDYQGLAAAGDNLFPVWGDTSTGQLQIDTRRVPLAELG